MIWKIEKWIRIFDDILKEFGDIFQNFKKLDNIFKIDFSKFYIIWNFSKFNTNFSKNLTYLFQKTLPIFQTFTKFEVANEILENEPKSSYNT